jgi:hypothetical protein
MTSISTPAMQAKAVDDPTNLLRSTILSTDRVDAAGFTTVSIAANGAPVRVAEDASLSVQPGGKIALAGSHLTILGDLSAPAGSISMTSSGVTNFLLFPASAATPLPGDVVIGSHATISAAGRWTNNAVPGGNASAEDQSDAFINGGSVSIVTDTNAAGAEADLTGSIVLEKGSVVDVSSGGYIDANGRLKASGGIPVGNGGSITLSTYNGSNNASLLSGAMPTHGRIDLDGTLLGYGFSGGGTLTLQALSIQIGGDPASLPGYALYLPTTFFSEQGFGAYQLSAILDATIAPGVALNVTQRNYIPNYQALLKAPTGTNLNDIAGNYVSLGTLDAYHRQATDFSLSAGAYLNWATSPVGAINPPSYAGITGAVLLDHDRCGR